MGSRTRQKIINVFSRHNVHLGWHADGTWEGDDERLERLHDAAMAGKLTETQLDKSVRNIKNTLGPIAGMSREDAIRHVFNRNSVDPGLHMDGSTEDPDQRVNRLATSSRSILDIESSVQNIAISNPSTPDAPSSPPPPPEPPPPPPPPEPTIPPDDVVDGDDKADRNALAFIEQTLTNLDFSKSQIDSLTDWAWNQIQDGASPQQIQVELPHRDEFRERFPVIHQMREAGETPPSAQQVLTFEQNTREVVSSFGLPDEFHDRDHITRMIMGGLSPQQLQQRLNTVSQDILARGDEIKEVFAKRHGISGLSDASLLASAITPGVPPHEFEHKIRAAQVGGTASKFGFDRGSKRVDELVEAGIGADQAQELFRDAQQQIPMIERLRQRHRDPNDPFNIRAFEDLAVFGDDDQRRRVQRLFAQEQSQFSQQQLFGRDQEGNVTGLRQQ